jgi:hypothetical protein
VPGEPRIEGDQVLVPYSSKVALRSAMLHYTSDTGLRSKRTWKSLPAVIRGDTISAGKPPADANTWFVSLTDERDAMVTTAVRFMP